MILEDSIEIKTTPEKLWDFFLHIAQNFKAWHPEEHGDFRWIKGKPLEEGSIAYFEEYLYDKLYKSRAVYTRVVPNRLIEMKPLPVWWRVIYTKGTYTIESKRETCIFTGATYLRMCQPGGMLVRKQLEGIRKHIKEEGENLKKLLEH